MVVGEIAKVNRGRLASAMKTSTRVEDMGQGLRNASKGLLAVSSVMDKMGDIANAKFEESDRAKGEKRIAEKAMGESANKMAMMRDNINELTDRRSRLDKDIAGLTGSDEESNAEREQKKQELASIIKSLGESNAALAAESKNYLTLKGKAEGAERIMKTGLFQSMFTAKSTKRELVREDTYFEIMAKAKDSIEKGSFAEQFVTKHQEQLDAIRKLENGGL